MKRVPLISMILALILMLGNLCVLPQSALAADLQGTTDGLILHYDMSQIEGTTVKDKMASFDGNWVNPQNAAWLKGTGVGAISFTGNKTNNSYIEIPQGVLNGLTDITVSAVVNWKGLSGAEWMYALGQDNTKYMYFTPKYNSGTGQARFGMTTGSWNTEVSAKAAAPLAANQWKLVTTVMSGANKTLTLYVDGVAVQTTVTNFTLDQIRKASGPSGYIGKSFYSADPYFGGMVADFKIYNRALTEAEIGGLQTDAAQQNYNGIILDYAANQLGYANFIGSNTSKDVIKTNLSFPANGLYGTTMTWESQNKNVISDQGVVTRPSADDENQTVVLTATISNGVNSVKRDFIVTVLRSMKSSEIVNLDAQALKVNNIRDVRGNLTLPTKGENGSTIAWVSDNAAMITPTGEVARPANGSGDAEVKLTAHIAKDGITITKGFVAAVKEMPKTENYEGYLFGYFTGEGSSNGEQIYFSLSQGNDPLHWQQMNGGNPVLTSTLGDKGVRDPFILRSPEGDRFYLIATDLKIFGNGNWDASQRTGSRSIMVWESTDLVHWSNQRMAEVSPPTAGNTWAPEISYDKTTGEYVIFWASKIYADSDVNHTGSTYNKIIYSKTRDFYTFTEPAVYMDFRYSIIDTTMIEHGGKTYRFTKDERSNTSSTPNGKFVFQESGNAIFDPNFTMIKEGIGKGSISHGEGPTLFKSNTEDKWYLFIDENGGRGYVPFETTNLNSGTWTLSANYSLPSSPRHGTVLPVTKAEYDKLLVTVPAVQQPTSEVRVTGVTINQANAVLNVGQQTQLQAAVAPVNAANPAVVWTSSDEQVAEVDGTGKITALKAGKVYVSSTSIDGSYLAVAEVNVQSSASNVSLNGVDTVTAGQNFDVIFSLNNVSENVKAQSVTVTYDPEKVEFLSVDSARDGVQVLGNKATIGQIQVIAVNTETGPNGPSFKLSFKAKEREDSVTATIAAANIIVGTASGEEIPLNGTSHSVLINNIMILGDINGDGRISIGDIGIMAANYGIASVDPNWHSYKRADMNNDGIIDIVDLATVARLITG